MEYNGSTTLISGITQANNGTYPLVDSEYIQYKDEENADGSYVSVRQKLDEIEVLNENKLDYAGDSDINSIIPNLFEEKVRITESTKIDNTLNSDLIIDSIEGNYYQELGEVFPTPDKEIPIFSKKINVNGEIVELRSLKESGNLIDINYAKALDQYNHNYVEILDNNTVQVTNKDARLSNDDTLEIKHDGTYRPHFEFESIQGNAKYGMITLYHRDNQSSGINFPSNGSIVLKKGKYRMYFYHGQQSEDDSNNIVRYKNIMLVEGTTVPSTYVAPTVRDYKIVNHSNKKSWIERNVKNIRLTSSNTFMQSGFGGMETQLLDAFHENTATNRAFCTLFDHDSANNGLPDANCWRMSKQYLQFNYPEFNSVEKWRGWIDTVNLEFQYRLATPVIEEIPYDENDNSELGESFQDTISPSPTIFSDIEYVDRIEIKTIGKNYFDIEKARNLENWKPSNQGGYSYFKIQVKKGQKYILHYNNILEPGLGFYIGLVNNKEGSNISNWIYHNSLQDLVTNSLSFTAKYDYVSFQISSNSILRALNKLIDLQLEESDIATTYEPYQETAISYQLSKPLLKIGDYTDVINLSDLSRINNCLYEDISNFNIVGGTEYENMKGVYFCIAIPNANNARKTSTPVICNTISKMTSRFDCNGMGIYGGVNIDINFKDIYITPPYSNAKVKEFFKNVNTKIAYVLKEPTTEPLESGLLEIIKSLKTFSPVTNILIKKIEPTLNCRFNKI